MKQATIAQLRKEAKASRDAWDAEKHTWGTRRPSFFCDAVQDIIEEEIESWGSCRFVGAELKFTPDTGKAWVIVKTGYDEKPRKLIDCRLGDEELAKRITTVLEWGKELTTKEVAKEEKRVAERQEREAFRETKEGKLEDVDFRIARAKEELQRLEQQKAAILEE